MTENKSTVERHGCLVCAKILSVLAVYAPTGELVDCVVTSSGGQCIPNVSQPLVACSSHTAEEIEHALKKWQAARVEESESEYEQA